MAKHIEDQLLVYRLKDDSLEFGTEIITALRSLYASGVKSPGTDELATFLAGYFPAETYRLNPESHCGHYLPVDPFNAHSKETLLIDCPGGLQNPFGQSFKHWGYQIIPGKDRLNVLRGYQASMPNDPLRRQMNDEEHLRYAQSFSSDIKLFPNRFIDPYHLRKLPSKEEFLDDMSTALIVY